MVVNENSNPNGGGGILLSRDDTNNDSMMKIGGGNGATTRRPPPPRASLTTSRPKFNRTSPSPSQSKTAAGETQLANDAAVSNRSALALVPTDSSAAVEDEENLSLWVVGYGKTKCPSASHIRCFFFRRSFTSSILLCSFAKYNFFLIKMSLFSFDIIYAHIHTSIYFFTNINIYI
jgi:hypothetical protein